MAPAVFSQGFLKKLQKKAEDATVNKAGSVMEKKLDKVDGKKPETPIATPPAPPATTAATSAPAVATAKPIEVYSKFDFVAGEQVLIADDFAQDAIGEFATLWNTNNKGEVVKIDGVNWLKIYQRSMYLTPNKNKFPENYTVEFDLIMDMHNKGYLYPELSFTLLNTGTLAPSDNAVFRNQYGEKAMRVNMHLGGNNDTKGRLHTYVKGATTFSTDYHDLRLLEKSYGKPVHFAMSIQKQRFRLWINEEKIYDLPKVIEDVFNQVAFNISGSNYSDNDLSFYLSNFKIATGKPDVRSKLLTEGKFSTTGITFDVNSDVIRPASYGIIKEIGEALNADKTVSINIIGHTDSDGSKTANEALSLKRAAAVKKALTENYQVAEERITVTGKGAAEPVADNKTPEGKAKNRRVEFIKK
jgi:outer membrane protein OmpA-like peptidoglycan-associated protein